MAPLRKQPMGDYVKMGFGFGLGGILATLVFLTLAMALFITGFILVKKEQKKPKEERQGMTLIVGLMLMGIGCILGLGFGSGVLLSSIENEI